MKVYLGKYNGPILLRWSSNFYRWKYSNKKYKQLLHKIVYFFIDKTEDIAQFLISNSINILLNKLPTQFKIVKIDKYDTWNLDCTLAQIIHPCLIEFKNNLHSYPSEEGMKEDVERIIELSQTTKHYDPVVMPEFKEKDMQFEYWKVILDEMIWAFKHAKDGSWAWQEPFYDNFNSTEIDKIQTRINNGIHLFSKYYFNLWD